MIALIFEALKKFLLESKEELAIFTEEKIKPQAKSYFILLVILAILAAIPPVVLFYFGALSESKVAIIAGGVWSALFLVLFKGAAAPLGIVYEALKGGTKGSVQRFLGGIEAIFAGKLIFALIACFIPFSNNPSLIPVFMFSAFLIGILAPGILKPGVIAGIVIVSFGGILIAILFPYTAQKAAMGLGKTDALLGKPSKLLIRCNMEMNFFDQKGDSMVWYYIDYGTQNKYEIELYNNPGLHSIYREELIPITPDIARKVEKLSKEMCKKEKEKTVKIIKKNKTVQKNKIVQKKTIAVKNQNMQSNNISPPAKLNSIHYINDHSFLNLSGTSEIAIVIVDDRSKKKIETIRELSSYFTSKSLRVSDSFFNSKFDKVFNDIYSGQKKLQLSDLYQHIDYIILGKKRNKAVTNNVVKKQNYPTTGVEIEIIVISVKTGLIIDEFTEKEDAYGMSPDSAEKRAIERVLENIQKRILEKVA